MEIFLAPFITFILAVIIRTGKATWLIAGYNTLSKEKKDKYDARQLNRFISNLLFAMSALLFLLVVSITYNIVALAIVTGAIFIVVLFSALIYANTGNRFQK